MEPYLLPKNIEKFKINIEQLRKLSEPFYLLFRDVESEFCRCESTGGMLNEPSYIAEGWVSDGIYFENEYSGKQLCVFWISPAGDEPEETNWRSLSEVELFSVSQEIFISVQKEIKARSKLYEKVYNKAMALLDDENDWFEFMFDPKSKVFKSKKEDLITLDLCEK